ncbi:MAG TPA: hypothetical protein VIT23_00815, partial [Terrimicrobiaceae bacterium]
MRISTVFLFFLALATGGVRAEAASSSRDPASPTLSANSSSLVRVNSTNQAFDYFRPWTKKAPFLRRGLGVVVQGGQ